MATFTIDGVEWPYPCDIQRKADVKASDISGLLLDGSYFNDVIGTYMSYTVKIAVPLNDMVRYRALYNVLTDPVDGHTCVFPYNSTTVQITARVDGISDVYVRIGNKKYWKGIQFDIIANNPTKQKLLSTVINRGLTPMPAPQEAEDGDMYVYDAATDTWVQEEYDNADTMQF